MPKVSDMARDGEGMALTRHLVPRWFPSGGAVAALGTVGFSGSPVWLVRPADAPPHVLKGFAEGTTRQRAEWVHAVAHGIHQEGVHEIPVIRDHTRGDTIVVTCDGRLWEMVRYVEGDAVDVPSPSQIAAAMRSLARIHTAAATLSEGPPGLAPSRAMTERVARARELCDTPWQTRLRTPTEWSPWSAAIGPRLAVACEAFESGRGAESMAALAALSTRPLPCQVVLRDVWSEHVLFAHNDADSVSGIIDLHAAGIDTPATDIGRLLGSWIPSDGHVEAAWWATALVAYGTVRPLSEAERRLVPLMAASSIVFGLDNWFRWTLAENRVFKDKSRVVSRVDRLVKSLPAALNVMIDTVSQAGLTPENSSP